MPGFVHTPVLLAEVLEALRPQPEGRYVDGTVGGGGHASAILRASAPGGWLFGCDRDEEALAEAAQRLSEFAGRFQLKRGNFSELAEWLKPQSFDGVLLDLGVSSWQVDQAERGFSFQEEGPLDMRMDRRQPLTAAQLVNETNSEELAQIFLRFGEEPAARRIARAIERKRRLARFETTGQLAGLVEGLLPRQGRRMHPATRVFQALRIAVNDELGSLQRGLMASMEILKTGGRLAVITFHSLEDRVVKQFGREWSRAYQVQGEVDLPEFRVPRAPRLKWVNRKPIRPAAEEVKRNPRSRSAQLRVFEKL